jgi:hypothetical protein
MDLQNQITPQQSTAHFPKMISLRLGERMRQRLASRDTRGDGVLDGGQRASGPVFHLNEVENFPILGKAGDEPRHDAAQRRKVLRSCEIFDRLDFHERACCKRRMGRPIRPKCRDDAAQACFIGDASIAS